MCGFEVRILPNIRTMGGEQFSLKDAVCDLTNDQTKERTAQAFLRLSDDGVQQFNNRIPQVLMSAGIQVEHLSTFTGYRRRSPYFGLRHLI
jgi:pre-mRNA-processing factor 8